MATFVETATRTDTAAGAVAQYLRVKTPGAIAAAGSTDVAIGVMEKPCLAAGACTIRLRTAQGTMKMVASEGITAGNAVYAAADGKIAASGTVYEGIALETCTADDDVIEVLPMPNVDLVAAAGITLPTVTFNGTTGANEIRVPDNLADGLSIKDGTGDLMVFTTTTGALAINFAARFSATGNTANTAGVGIPGTADNFYTSVEKIGTIIKTTILIDVDGLNSGDTAGDIVGADGAGVAHLGQITAAVNGTLFAGKITCLETPAGGDPDIDLWYADEATGVEDTAITSLTGETQCIDHGDWTAGDVDGLTAFPAANKYLYLTTGDATDATYTAGILLIELYGKAA
jgi:hypothetical protein